MMQEQQFTDLLERYLGGHTTPEEQLALMQAIKSGMYDDFLKRQIDEALFHEVPSADLDNHRADELRHRILNSEKHTAQLIPAALPLRRIGRSLAVAATVIGIVALAGWWLITRKAPESRIAQKDSPAVLPVPASKGKKYIRLQDGSTVLLNEESRLEYPDTFSGGTREVTLVGEAYFDIRHDALRPFIVHTGKISTTVLGTAFDIRAYPNQPEITVTVTRGKVKVGDGKKTFGFITPNERIAVNTGNNTWKHEKADAEQLLQWKEQYLVLDNLSLEEAAILIGNKYHVTISFSNESLKQCRINATFLNNESLEQVLTVVAGVVNATYTIQPNDQVIMTGKGCQ